MGGRPPAVRDSGYAGAVRLGGPSIPTAQRQHLGTSSPQGSGDPGSETTILPREQIETSPQLGFGWNVIVWDDPVNLMAYVVYVFQTLFGYPREKATQLMLEVHEQGKSLVATADREKAEYYVTRLHGYGLQATLERATPSDDA